MTNTTAELERQIEQMVAAHVAALRKGAQGAVERAFAMRCGRQSSGFQRRCYRARFGFPFSMVIGRLYAGLVDEGPQGLSVLEDVGARSRQA